MILVKNCDTAYLLNILQKKINLIFKDIFAFSGTK